MIAGAALHLAAQRLDFRAQVRSFERVLDGDAEFVEVERLADRADRVEPRMLFEDEADR